MDITTFNQKTVVFLLFFKHMEQNSETFVCKRCEKETSTDEGSTFHQVCGVCMATTKGPGLTQEGKDWLRSELKKKRSTKDKIRTLLWIYQRVKNISQNIF